MKGIKILHGSDGQWRIEGNTHGMNPAYKQAILRYTACISPVFEAAKEKSEFDFIHTLLGIRGIESAGWDSYESTLNIYKKVIPLIQSLKDFETSRHLSLWLYGHIIEASEPYEIAANLLRVASGERFSTDNFPDEIIGKGAKRRTRPVFPLGKIEKLRILAARAGKPDAITPFEDVVDHELRNAIFHSDYALYRFEVRIRRPVRAYSDDLIMALINKALAYHETWNNLRSNFIASYQQPQIIPIPAGFSNDPQEKAVTIIRTGYGVVGLKDNWTKQELAVGHIPFRIAKLHNYEIKMVNADPFLNVLPKDRIEQINNVLNCLPKFVRARIVRLLQDKF